MMNTQPKIANNLSESKQNLGWKLKFRNPLNNLAERITFLGSSLINGEYACAKFVEAIESHNVPG